MNKFVWFELGFVACIDAQNFHLKPAELASAERFSPHILQGRVVVLVGFANFIRRPITRPSQTGETGSDFNNA